MYRIVYFDKNFKFKKVVISEEYKDQLLIALAKQENVEVYKCNAKGNNYTGRRIFPPQINN